jgi:ribosome-binding protein aMBF1 (putative translation factor)
VITGAQIKAARRLLGWPPSRLAQKARVVRAIIELAEKADGEPPLTIEHMKVIRAALEAAGVEFTDGGRPGVRLRADWPRT